MDPNIKAAIYNIGGRFWDYAVNRMLTKGSNPVENRIAQMDKVIESLPAAELTETPTSTEPSPETAARAETDIATACVPCALGHVSTSAGLLNEAFRFKDEGMQSNEILDRIAKVLEEQNALERVDLTPEKIRNSPPWEKDLAEEALGESRRLRHLLEGLSDVKQLEEAAASTSTFYRRLNREWFKRRLAHRQPQVAPQEASSPSEGEEEGTLSLEEAKTLAAEEAAKEVEERWHSQEQT